MDNQSIKNDKLSRERFCPPPNMPPGNTVLSVVLYQLRRVLDLQVASVLQRLAPFLSDLSGSVLEIGCGAQPYRHLIPSSCRYQGLDWEGAGDHFGYSAPDTVYYKNGTFPFDDGIYENLFHTEVLEHIFQKDFFLKECRRVLRPGGTMFFTVPFQARYHYIPFDYWRFTPAALEKMLENAGFKDIVVKSRGNDITVASYKVISVIYRWLQSGFAGKLLGLLAFPLLVGSLVIGHLSLKLKIGSEDDCLGYIVICK